jgi:hypothetical protein
MHRAVLSSLFARCAAFMGRLRDAWDALHLLGRPNTCLASRVPATQEEELLRAELQQIQHLGLEETGEEAETLDAVRCVPHTELPQPACRAAMKIAPACCQTQLLTVC